MGWRVSCCPCFKLRCGWWQRWQTWGSLHHRLPVCTDGPREAQNSAGFFGVWPPSSCRLSSCAVPGGPLKAESLCLCPLTPSIAWISVLTPLAGSKVREVCLSPETSCMWNCSPVPLHSKSNHFISSGHRKQIVHSFLLWTTALQHDSLSVSYIATEISEAFVRPECWSWWCAQFSIIRCMWELMTQQWESSAWL